MIVKECVAMVLAGGRGERLGALTRYYPKPTVHFGVNRRIIDFTLENCRISGINTVGILSQYFSSDLHAYICSAYDCRPGYGGIYLLPSPDDENYYVGTADAVFKNMRFINRFDPECVLVLAGDHIYNMNYGRMIAFHKLSGADVTVASTQVPLREASRFGIFSADITGRVDDFNEKPANPQSNLASMGIYVFKWDILKRYLLADSLNDKSKHDFGRNVLPEMLKTGAKMYIYEFSDYWRDVGTVASLWEANMDHIDAPAELEFPDGAHAGRVHSRGASYTSSDCADVRRSVISDGCSVFGRVEHSVLGEQVTIGKGAEVIDSVVMPGVYIGDNARVYRSIVGTRAVIMDNAEIGLRDGPEGFLDQNICSDGVSLVSPWLYISEEMKFRSGSHICKERLEQYAYADMTDNDPYRELISDRYPGHFRRYSRLARR